MGHSRFTMGEWVVDTATNSLGRDGERRRLEPLAMDVLARLCLKPGEVVATDELIEACWGDAGVGDNPLHKTIAQLRRALGDTSSAPSYIETIRRRGYRIIAEIRRDGEASAGSWLHGSPFRGLQAFEAHHAPIFFGRHRAIELLLACVRRQSASASALILVLGPSGAGKTSLIQAGLLPRLFDGACASPLHCAVHLNCTDIGELDLFQALGSTLLDAETAAGAPIFPGLSGAALGAMLGADSAAIADRLGQQLPERALALCVDHFEGIFQMGHIGADERQRFVAALATLAKSPAVLVVLVCRNDFYPQIADYPTLLDLKEDGGHFDVKPPSRSELEQIVRAPAASAGIEFEIDAATGIALDETLCDAIGSAANDTLPLLQYCLQELYLQRGADGKLSHKVFQALGGIEGAIAARADQVLEALTPAQRAALPRVLGMLVRVAEDELAVTARRPPWSSLASGAERELVTELVNSRLFVSCLHGGVPAFGIAHEAVLRRWPRVVDWIERHRQTLQLRSRTSAQAARWHASGRSRDLLLPPGAQVRQAHLLLTEPEFPLGAQERAFIHASVQRARLGERLRLLSLTIVLALAGLAGVLWLTGRHAQQLAERHRTEAEGLMGFMLGELVDKLRPLGRLDLLDTVSGRALGYLADVQEAGASGAAMTQRVQALHLIAEVAMARADPAGATTALNAARLILDRQLAATPNEKIVLKNQGDNAFWLGQIQFDKRAWRQAREHMNAYLHFSQRLTDLAPDNTAAWIEQSYAQNSLGSIALEMGEVDAAARAFDASVQLKTKVLGLSPNDKLVAADLADSLSWLASAKETQGELGVAGRLYARELAIMRDLYAASPSDALYGQRLSNAHIHQAELSLALGRVGLARTHFEEAERLLIAITGKDPSNKKWKMALGLTTVKLLDLDADTVAPARRVATLWQWHQAIAGLGGTEQKNVQLQTLTTAIELRLVAQYFRQRDNARARSMLSRSLATLQALRASVPHDPTMRNELVEALLLQADLEWAEGRSRQAVDACLAAQELLRPAASSRDHRVLAPWVRTNDCIGSAQQASQQRALLIKMEYRHPAYMRHVNHVN